MKSISTRLAAAAVAVALATVTVWQLRRSDAPLPSAPALSSPPPLSNASAPTAVTTPAPAVTPNAAPPIAAADTPPSKPTVLSAAAQEPAAEPEGAGPPAGPPDFGDTYRDLAGRFRTEARDPGATGIENEILTHLSQETGLALTTIQIECRTRICSVQLSGSNPGKQSQLFATLEGFGRVIGTSLKGADGVAITEVFVERRATTPR
jgi:hypothetical protein